MQKLHHLAPAVLLLGCLISASNRSAWGDTISFDHAQEFDATFQAVGVDKPGWNAAAGKFGTGGLIAGNSNYLAAVQNGNPIQLAPGQSVTVAMSFLYKDQVTRIAQRNAGVFLTVDPILSPLDAPDGSLITVFFHNVSNSPGAEQTVISYALGGPVDLSDKGQPYTGSDWWDSDAMRDHWCQLQVRFTKLPTNGLWELDIRILDLGLDGTAEPVEIFSNIEAEVSAEALYSAPEIFAGFQNHRYDRGFRSMDDFEVTIE